MELKLEGKTALVTGASKGIGLAVVQALAAEGVQVAACARTTSEALAEATPLTRQADLSDAGQTAEMVEWALGELGGIDLLVNNVGGSPARTDGFLAISDEEWQHAFELNFFSTVRTTRAALPSLLERKGNIVNIGSVNSQLALPRLIDYSAAKAAMTNFAKSLAEEYGEAGLRVNTISPGPTRTAVWTSSDGMASGLSRSAGIDHEEFVSQVPAMTGLNTGKFTEPEELAVLVVLLASGRVPNMNGADLVVDGGMLKQL
ncbi:NAD(P)-dependent dehydrogenase, short-chain alcohol dehydrogenase family [Saccharopolyspora antimicrobica]|uniref:NAD(P)-dependent dehydrogenase (Short-subunit alcohol dehydrogenase family) n=2 Tax=Saccharopolyspora TaxID=1835 RepID=A0A1I4VR09_9PSEU|nr:MULTISPECIES: SDR family NAD(P)-dependent oxidoreductase [Saccharopolyspora]RKT87248.1 NAD(P)-dependent dehydrogenase (short-subunit alcohol dehydrogenase family) [Saccharopolyspora antimicrobica]SEF85750.1 NAD(P)-dependent dehydrogenase, short-chain alcohol dehydrogenase family [Saccharopolyspora kobensis]SFC61540.1 NAD(P)-dependent dehydrogenase, short-chain alcohol dehydrogenase family [Saccharopolyspora kobensis]SFN03731.1 NAD(P)-dependent dehydrogenase, short-chain alcohol dehydrogenase